MIRYMSYVFIPSGASKLLSPKPLKQMWPTLPDWFWPACGVFELVIPALLNFYEEKTDLAVLMAFMFLGGASSASTTIAFKPENFLFIIPTIIAMTLIGQDAGIEPSLQHVGGIAFGFIAGNLISITSGQKRGGTKKTK